MGGHYGFGDFRSLREAVKALEEKDEVMHNSYGLYLEAVVLTYSITADRWHLEAYWSK